ncbi:MAG TPA: RNA polymerase sigma factor [Ktedonobacterales bacterium]
MEERKNGGGPALDFDAFFARHERPLYAYLCRLLPSEELAVEIAQEAFFRLWTHLAEVQRYERPQAWLYRVATNLAISALRRRQATPFSQLLATTHTGTANDGESPGGPEFLLADTLDIEGQAAERDAIARALRHLSERERAALLLRAVQGFSHEEIAEALEVSVANARQIVARARQHFRHHYDAEPRPAPR